LIGQFLLLWTQKRSLFKADRGFLRYGPFSPFGIGLMIQGLCRFREGAVWAVALELKAHPALDPAAGLGKDFAILIVGVGKVVDGPKEGPVAKPIR
jgi:hypothetical protein